ncbi:hypothetical protein POM88_026645 [Heracleum sosnowskyi]|uniref:Uncharacterized protein n=1 Tax=Heracleum sosnowskyi TaxID=360622 RepID=A0AAD8I7G8_9APIA|nr:hypothetical protein POM88_026645 [Heracleum sosnowskyi]
MAFAGKFSKSKASGYGSIIPDAPGAESHLLTKTLGDKVGNSVEQYIEAMEKVKLKQGLKLAMSISGEGNAYLSSSGRGLSPMTYDCWHVDAAPEVVEKPGDGSLSRLKMLYTQAKDLCESEVSGIHLLQTNPEIVKRWSNEVHEAVQSRAALVQFHALALLHKIRQNDR